MTVSTAPSARRRLALAHAVADDLAAAELHLLAIDGEVLLDLDEELGVGEAHLVAGGRAEHVGIGGAGDAWRAWSGSVIDRLAAVELLRRRQRVDIDVVEAARVDGDHLRPVRHLCRARSSRCRRCEQKRCWIDVRVEACIRSSRPRRRAGGTCRRGHESRSPRRVRRQREQLQVMAVIEIGGDFVADGAALASAGVVPAAISLALLAALRACP